MLAQCRQLFQQYLAVARLVARWDEAGRRLENMLHDAGVIAPKPPAFTIVVSRA